MDCAPCAPVYDTLIAAACAGETYAYNGIEISSGSSQSFVFTNAAGCDSTVTVNVAVLQPSNFTLNASACACPGETDGAILVDAVDAQTLIFQLDGAAIDEEGLLQLTSGTYTLGVSDASSECMVVEEITVEEQPTAQAFLPQRHPLPCDTWEIGLSVSLDGPAPATGFLWSVGAQTQNIIVNEPGPYWVEVSDDCGVQKLETTVEPEMPNEGTDFVCMANVFLPSGAEYPFNSVFAPQFSSEITVNNLTFSIYDRWGGLLFTTQRSDFGWDGADAQPGACV